MGLTKFKAIVEVGLRAQTGQVTDFYLLTRPTAFGLKKIEATDKNR
jgi:hypothetical protein